RGGLLDKVPPPLLVDRRHGNGPPPRIGAQRCQGIGTQPLNRMNQAGLARTPAGALRRTRLTTLGAEQAKVALAAFSLTQLALDRAGAGGAPAMHTAPRLAGH